MHRVVIIGGGFGGLYAAQKLKRAENLEVTMIDKRNFHLFQPLLYQVGTGSLSPANIASPLRKVLRSHKNTTVLLGEVVDFDVDDQAVILGNGDRIPYDSVIVAAGSEHHYFGNDHWREHAPPLKDVEDATKIRRKIFESFEVAERLPPEVDKTPWLTFAIIGGGPTGVELAGALAEIAMDTLKGDFRHIKTPRAKILLLEALDRILPTYPEDLSQRAKESLQKLGVEVRTGCLVTDISSEGVAYKTKEAEDFIPTHCVMWGAGVKGSPLGKKLSEATGCELNKGGQVIVEPDCSVANHPNIFVVGDLACFQHGTDQPLPGVAQVAMQQGKYVAKLIQNRIQGLDKEPFEYFDLGNMAVIGRHAAVADLHWTHLRGWIAWFAWLFIHLINLVEHQNKVLVFLQWAWSYLTFNRSARLITHPETFDPVPPPDQRESDEAESPAETVASG